MPTKLPYYTEKIDVTDRPRRFLTAFAAILEHSNYGMLLEQYSKVAAKCSRCADLCPIYEVTGEDRDIPCVRSELILRVYRRYFTAGGRMKARLFGGFELTDEDIHEMAVSMYRCTACRRCKLECPMGIDHGLLTHLSRWILAEIEIIPKALLVSVREQLEGETHNTSAIPVPALVDTCEFLEEEFRDIYQAVIKYPIDVEGADWVFFPAVSDYLLEPDTLMGLAAVLELSGASWTIGTGNFDGINYGLFYSDRMLGRIVRMEGDEVRRLKAKGVLVGECGHASRAAKGFLPTYCGGEEAPEVINIMEYTWEAVKSGRLKLTPDVIEERVTYHDPCNIARSGWILDAPRELLKIVCKDFVEMTPNREHNYCCGGGGGAVSIDEIREFRTKIGGKKKADQIRATGAKYLVAPCANCKKQLREVCEDNDLPDVEVVGLHDLLLRALDFSPVKMAPVPEDSGEEES